MQREALRFEIQSSLSDSGDAAEISRPDGYDGDARTNRRRMFEEDDNNSEDSNSNEDGDDESQDRSS